ncbi:MAG: DNA methyltransferase, partial [Acetatifactor sp.]
MEKKGKLELTWTDKYKDAKLEPRILMEVEDKSAGDSTNGNMLIHGDNLLALKALELQFAGTVKCIYIDPPYNTGTAFEHYDDGIEHSKWLSMMNERLKCLQTLLREDGTIFIQIDDNEQAYLRVLCDEIFGRKNFLNMISVNAKVSAGASGGGEDKKLKKNIEYILIYCKNMDSFPGFKPIYKRTELMKYIENMKEDGKSYKYTSVLYRCDNFEHFKTIKDGAGDDIEIYKVNDYEIKSVKQVAQLEGITEA